jgi:hypothetical protein
MNRIPLAIIMGLIGFVGYVAAVLLIADFVVTLHWTLQAIYFVIAGSIWVLPMRWLMLWSVHQR